MDIQFHVYPWQVALYLVIVLLFTVYSYTHIEIPKHKCKPILLTRNEQTKGGVWATLLVLSLFPLAWVLIMVLVPLKDLWVNITRYNERRRLGKNRKYYRVGPSERWVYIERGSNLIRILGCRNEYTPHEYLRAVYHKYKGSTEDLNNYIGQIKEIMKELKTFK